MTQIFYSFKNQKASKRVCDVLLILFSFTESLSQYKNIHTSNWKSLNIKMRFTFKVNTTSRDRSKMEFQIHLDVIPSIVLRARRLVDTNNSNCVLHLTLCSLVRFFAFQILNINKVYININSPLAFVS